MKIRVINNKIKDNFMGKVIGNVNYHPLGTNGLVKVEECYENKCPHCRIGKCIGHKRVFDTSVHKIEKIK